MGKKIKVDVAIVGAGTAGLTAQYYAEKEGASTLIMDPGPLGTTCARVGCMPSKLLIAAADAAHCAAGAGVFGVRTNVRVDSAKVLRRVRAWRDRFVGSMLEDYRGLEKKKALLRERASFLGPRTLRAGDTEVEFKSAVIATGSVTLIPAAYRQHQRFILTRDNIFEQKRLPGSLLVVGAGLIGLELGQAVSRLGTRVTLLGLDRMTGPLTDPVVREEAIKVFSSEMELCPDHELLGLKPEGARIRVSYRSKGGKARSAVFEKILVAAGQKPDLEGLALENSGLPLDARGLPQTDPRTMRVGRSAVFMAGDADPFRPALHEAAFEGRVAGRNAARFPRVEKYGRFCGMAIAFTDPQMAVVGKSRKELGAGFCCGELDYSEQGRALVMNAGRGKMRIYGDKTSGRLLGAEIFGPRAEHTAHLLAWAIQRGLAVNELLRLPFYHPALEEGLQDALKELSRRLRRPEPCVCEKHLPGA